MATLEKHYSTAGKSLITRVARTFLFWNVLTYSCTIVGLWWFTHLIIEKGLSRQALQLAPRFDEIGAPLFFADSSLVLQRVKDESERVMAVGSVRYFDKNANRIVGAYEKNNFDAPAMAPNKQMLEMAGSSPDGYLSVVRKMGVVQEIVLVYPIREKSLSSDDLMNYSPLDKAKENSTIIGWLELSMDVAPPRLMVSSAIGYGAVGLAFITLFTVVSGRRAMRRALSPLSGLEIPLKKVALGDFNVRFSTESQDKEIVAIGNAVNAAIAGVRQRDIEKDEAVRAKASAEAANQAKSVFLANMSHEIRTPLNGVLGFLSLLSRTTLDATQREYLKTVDLSAKTLLSVINDVLDFSKIEAGRMNIEYVDMDLCRVVENAVILHAAVAEEKGIDLALVCTNQSPINVLGDPARVTQIVSNLVGNAVKFTNKGSVNIRVIMSEETSEHMVVKVEVRDSGIGISEEALAKLFKPFTQADTSTTRKHGGSGLGLTISKKLVELMGGSITVQSKEGFGSTFTVVLRLHIGNRPNKLELYRKLARLKVLVVSENDTIGNSAVENLRAWRLSATIVKSISEAVQELKAAASLNDPYKVCFVDNGTKDVYSDQFTKYLKSNEENIEVHGVLLSTLSDRRGKENILAYGFGNVLYKPVKSSDLFDELVNTFVMREESDNNAPAGVSHLHSNAFEVNVLVVDDNDINRQLASILIEDLGGKVDAAENGLQAVEKIKKTNYDLVLMDVHMPVMDGLEATKIIRELKGKFTKLPIVALTANALGGDRERFLDAGMDDYLSKPINEDALRRVYARFCGQTFPSPTQKVLKKDESMNNTREENLPILDPQQGVKSAFGKADVWQKALTMLLKDLSSNKTMIETAFSAGNLPEVQRLAHKLAGASSYCGTIALQRSAAELENAIKRNESSSVANLFSSLVSNIAKLLELEKSGHLPDAQGKQVF